MPSGTCTPDVTGCSPSVGCTAVQVPFSCRVNGTLRPELPTATCWTSGTYAAVQVPSAIVSVYSLPLVAVTLPPEEKAASPIQYEPSSARITVTSSPVMPRVTAAVAGT